MRKKISWNIEGKAELNQNTLGARRLTKERISEWPRVFSWNFQGMMRGMKNCSKGNRHMLLLQHLPLLLFLS